MGHYGQSFLIETFLNLHVANTGWKPVPQPGFLHIQYFHKCINPLIPLPDDKVMVFTFDGSMEMWSMVAQAAGYATAFIYGAARREYTRLWPILVLGICLDTVAEIFLSSNGFGGPGMYWGALLYPLYSLVACVGGILTRVAIEAVVHPSASGKNSRTNGTFPPYRV